MCDGLLRLIGKALIGQALVDLTRPGDVVARWGSSQFLVLCPGLDDGALQRMGDRLVAAVHDVSHAGIAPTASAGVQASDRRPLELDEVNAAAVAAHDAGGGTGPWPPVRSMPDRSTQTRPTGHDAGVDHELTIQIDAPPARVWKVLMDIGAWPEWTASMIWIRLADPDEPLGLGSEVHIKQPRLRAALWVVTTFEEGKRFAWTTSGGGVTTEGDHELTPTPDGTSVTFRLHQTGWLSGLTGLVGGGAIRKAVEMEAEGLKARSEGTR